MPIGVLFSSYLSLRQKERVIKPAFSVLVVLRKVTLMSSYEILEEKVASLLGTYIISYRVA